MSQDEVDFYELLQISPNAEPETIHRVYRLLAQRVHPDNVGTGDATRFRAIHEAYEVLSDPEKRAKYDIRYHERRQDRWRLVSSAIAPDGELPGENDFALEQVFRMTVLEVLYTRRRMEPRNPGVFDLDLEGLTGRPREHLEFTIWYLLQKKHVIRADNSRLTITAEGVDCLEQNYQANIQRRRLPASPIEKTAKAK
jgi:curved DNA-binding protein CbpA